MIKQCNLVKGPFDGTSNMRIDTSGETIAIIVSSPTIDVMGATSENYTGDKPIQELVAESIKDQMQNSENRTWAIYKRIGDEASATQYEFVESKVGKTQSEETT